MYTNPTGLCAECHTTINIRVCCDELPYISGNCDNTGEERCDTRFRWTIRLFGVFGASLETRPNSGYNYTDCAMSPSTCPFSEMSTTFNQGPTAILGVTPNPLPVSNPTFVWTVSSFSLQLYNYTKIWTNTVLHRSRGQWTPEHSRQSVDWPGQPQTWSRLHRGDDVHWILQHISHMTMSFRVECSPGFCGADCTTPQNNPRVATCQADGTLTCTDNRFDPSPPVACNDCIYNPDTPNSCSTCLNNKRDPTNNCSLCTNTRYDPTTNCELCSDSIFNPINGCTSCLLKFYQLHPVPTRLGHHLGLY